MYDTLRLPVVRYLICLGLRQEDADEIVQETFLRVYKHLRADGADPNLRGWVFRVAHNLAINHCKKQRGHAALGDVEGCEEAFCIADPSPNAEEVVLRKERMRRVVKAMRNLSGQEMQCVHLRAEGFRYREIAKIMGIGTSTVADSLQRALAKLAGGQDA
jgi:RNA polymerase sigma-70 factor (ECF subfamily)